MDFEITKVELTQQPTIEMTGYDELLTQVEGLAEQMKTVEVTEDTLQGSKKLVSEVKKQYDILDSQRKAVKKQLMKPYEEIDLKMKQLKKVLDSGETAVRSQIKELEQKQRSLKEVEVKALFDEMFIHYKLPSIFTFEMFLESKHLNKTYSMSKVKTDMKVWFINIKNDIQMFRDVADEINHVANMVQEYAHNGLQASQAISTYKQARNDFKRLKNELGSSKKVSISIKPQHSEKGIRKRFHLAVYGQSDLNKLVQFCNKNNIDFEA